MHGGTLPPATGAWPHLACSLLCIPPQNVPPMPLSPKRARLQCGRFQQLAEFDEGRRSCRASLERHKLRRRRQAGDEDAERAQRSVPGKPRRDRQPRAAIPAKKRSQTQAGSAGAAAKAPAVAQQSKRLRTQPPAEARRSVTTLAPAPASPPSPARFDSPSPPSLLPPGAVTRSNSLLNSEGSQPAVLAAAGAPALDQLPAAVHCAPWAAQPAEAAPLRSALLNPVQYQCLAAPDMQPGLLAAPLEQPRQLCAARQPSLRSSAQQAAQPDPALLAELLAGDCLALPSQAPVSRMQLVHEALQVLQAAEVRLHVAVLWGSVEGLCRHALQP